MKWVILILLASVVYADNLTSSEQLAEDLELSYQFCSTNEYGISVIVNKNEYHSLQQVVADIAVSCTQSIPEYNSELYVQLYSSDMNLYKEKVITIDRFSDTIEYQYTVWLPIVPEEGEWMLAVNYNDEIKTYDTFIVTKDPNMAKKVAVVLIIGLMLYRKFSK